MHVIKIVSYDVMFDPDELKAVTEALNAYAAGGVLASTRTDIAEVVRKLHAGEPLTGQQADDLRVFLVRYLKSRHGDDMTEWPGDLGVIARQLQNRH